ncbi:rhodanese-like domain-containing protein [Paenibacillus aurantius]|uniref:Rhodanese-like domain-containing protein n=1 Tax=Paenibacillus aurantius TaxID=2918900 RepID=A0AA96LBM4_9BACL|nr:rhodanese-like domain-containing protein [Paenibacillus aurantius]WNQ09320.1 rhodanese-like domain-containing protein [Paenibacillus aurantius]
MEYELSPVEFNRMLTEDKGEKLYVLDVREIHEWNYYHLEGSHHMPMNTIPSRLGELPENETLYVICAHGVRSAVVCEYLLGHGFSDVKSVAGGMAAVSGMRGFAYD